jgi:hypothetical protein
MAVIAVAMLTYILPSVILNVTASVIIAICLIALLALRSIAWHKQRTTPYDLLVIIALLLAIVHLFTFSAFAHTIGSTVVVLLFALFFIMMAALFAIREARPEGFEALQDLRQAGPVMHPRHVPHVIHAKQQHKPVVFKGLEPIPERPPRWERSKRFIKSFRREPIPEIKPPQLGKVHGEAFKRGIEPIPEITVEHLHKLGVYETEPRKRK